MRLLDKLPTDSTPLTDEESERIRLLVERLRERHARLLAERGGVPFPDSAKEIRDEREERERRFS